MFGLSRREHRWKADQQAAETVLEIVKALAKTKEASEATSALQLELKASESRLRAYQDECFKVKAELARMQKIANGYCARITQLDEQLLQGTGNSHENKAIAEERQGAAKLAFEIISNFLECVDEPPDRNCSCHISPPCSDCVEHSHLRDTLNQAKAFIKKEQQK